METIEEIVLALLPYAVGGGGVLAFLVQWRQSSQSNISQLWQENRELRKEITTLRMELAQVRGELSEYKAQNIVDEETLVARIKTECPGDWRRCPLIPPLANVASASHKE